MTCFLVTMVAPMFMFQVRRVRSHRVTVISGETGCGKSSRVRVAGEDPPPKHTAPTHALTAPLD